MTPVESANELTEDTLEGAVIVTPHGIEWVMGVHSSRVDGRKLTPHRDEDGNLGEIVSEMGNYYNKSVDDLLGEALELLGYVEGMEEAQSLGFEYYSKSE